jgi:hypothetical protein
MSQFSELFSSSDHPLSLGAKFRRKRLAVFEKLFLENFNPQLPLKILDVGGTSYFWKDSTLTQLPQVEFTLLNLHQETSDHPRIKGVTGDATSMREYTDQSFDLVFSNSVIEHVYTLENQKKMAEEIRRVGKKHFIQTPNKYFPIEAHYAIPFAQYLPKELLFYLLTKTKISRLKKWNERDAQQYLEEIRLLNEKEMKELFPGSVIYREKVLGLTKSITAHNLS